MKIILDPGHGGAERGAVFGGLVEKALNLEYSKKIRDILQAYADVKLTRESDIDFGLNSRAAWINDQHPDLILSCHFNACDGSAHGTEIIHSVHAEDDVKNLSKELASGITTLGFPLRRVFSRESTTSKGKDYYGIIRNTKSPTIIIEPCFIDNVQDRTIMSGSGFIDRLVLKIADAVINHYNLHMIISNDIKTSIIEWGRRIYIDNGKPVIVIYDTATMIKEIETGKLTLNRFSSFIIKSNAYVKNKCQ